MYSSMGSEPAYTVGYGPNMMITCYERSGSHSGHGGLKKRRPVQPVLQQFLLYEPVHARSTTDYLDTPVLPIAAFAAGYNPVDCALAIAAPAHQGSGR